MNKTCIQGKKGIGVEVVQAALEMIAESAGFALTNRSMEGKEP